MLLTCKKCLREKEASKFSRHKQCKSGYDVSRCKSCKRAERDYAKVSIEKRIYHRAKSRATKKGIPFDLELEDIVLPKRCPVFGVKFQYGHVDWTYSIDRINPKLGYVKGNIAIISNKANRTKNDASLYELECLVAYMRDHEKTLDVPGA